ncbi:MAG: hypothetical protein AAF988_02475 [Pseudomonadota bacterium]
MIFKALKGVKTTNKHPESGNAMIYVLLAIALFGILTATLSSQNEQADGQDLDDELVELYASELIEYSNAAKQVVDQMLITGSTIDDLDFVNPSSSAFDTAPHIHKIHHPQGGGLTYKSDSYPDAFWGYVGRRGWEHITVTNVEWTESSANDIMLSFMDLNDEICQKINEKITGSSTVPTYTSGYTANALFREVVAVSHLDLDTAACAGCVGYSSLCVADPSAFGQRVFYTILAGR